MSSRCVPECDYTSGQMFSARASVIGAFFVVLYYIACTLCFLLWRTFFHFYFDLSSAGRLLKHFNGKKRGLLLGSLSPCNVRRVSLRCRCVNS